jgi:hypothetical protein
VLPGVRDSTGRLYVNTAAPSSTSVSVSGIALTDRGAVHIAPNVSPSRYVNGYGVTLIGQLCTSQGLTPVTWVGGLAQDSSGRLILA